MSESLRYLFVYGTLRPSLWPSALRPLLKTTICLGEASLPGRLYDLGPHPGAIPDSSSELLIQGEVLELPGEEGLLEALDKYEDFSPKDQEGSLFLRLQREVKLSNGQKCICWVYAYNRSPGSARLVSHGDYVRWRAKVS